MFGLAARVLSGMITPLTDQIADKSARLVKRLALFLAAGFCLFVTIIALSVALGLWVAATQGPVIGTLAVAGAYLAVAVACVVAAILDGRKSKRSTATASQKTKDTRTREADPDLDGRIDSFTAPLLRILQQLGLRREQLAVLAGASVAKQLGPLPLVTLAVVAGFLIGRFLKGSRGLGGALSIDTVLALLSSGLFGFGGAARDPETDRAPGKDEA